MTAIRVLYIESGSGAGGSSASLYRFVKVLKKNGVIPVVAARQGGPNIDKIREVGIPTLMIPKFFGETERWTRLFVIPRLLAETIFLGFICLKEKIKMIHLNTGVASGLSGIFVAKLLGIPCVSHARGNETRYMGHVAQVAARWVDEYLCVSEAVRRDYGVDRFKAKQSIKTIYDGLDPQEFQVDPFVRMKQRKALNLSETDCAIGLIARFVEGKGHEQFLLAAREVSEVYQNVFFFMVGANGVGNGNVYENRIRTLAKKLSFGDRMQFLNWQSDVRPVVAAMDFVVLPSLGEGLSLAVAEAMALGKAVIATKVGGLPELVRDGRDGILVSPSNIPELVGAIKELVVDRGKREKMAEKAQNRISKDFSIERVAGEILETYERLIHRMRSRTLARGTRRLKCVIKEGVSRAAWTGVHLMPRGTTRGKQFSILMYHHVVKEHNPYFPGIGERSLKEHLVFLKRHFTVLRLSEAVDILLRGKLLPCRTVCVTFDDGARDTFSVAFPILSEMKIPATVFLATGAMDGQKPLWTDLVASFVSEYAGEILTITGNGIERTFPTNSQSDKITSINDLKKWLKSISDQERVNIVENLARTSPFLSVQNSEMMTWEQARTMSQEGIEFGAHTVSHPILSKMSNDGLEKEIVGSKQRIEEMIGQRVSLFAYPNGEAGDFDQRTTQVLIANGFVASCSTIYGMNRDIKEPFVLKRIPGFEEPLSSLACRLLGYR